MKVEEQLEEGMREIDKTGWFAWQVQSLDIPAWAFINTHLTIKDAWDHRNSCKETGENCEHTPLYAIKIFLPALGSTAERLTKTSLA